MTTRYYRTCYGSSITAFFFSSRRRHTRLQGDWSSDVCSSDLSWRRPAGSVAGQRPHARNGHARPRLESRPARYRQIPSCHSLSTKKNEKACYLAEQSLPDVHRFSLVWLSPRQGDRKSVV